MFLYDPSPTKKKASQNCKICKLASFFESFKKRYT